MESFAIFSNNPLRRIQDQIANPGKVYMAGCGEKWCCFFCIHDVALQLRGEGSNWKNQRHTTEIHGSSGRIEDKSAKLLTC